MSYWICCSSCFHSADAERKLALTTCGHIICSLCYQKGIQGQCLICNTKCQVSLLSDKSSSEVKALFCDITSVATKHFTEISKVIMFQARHQKRLLSYYQQRNEKLEQTLVKMKQEMQQMMMKLNEQSTYITKLENSLQHQSAKTSSLHQMNHCTPPPHGHKPVLQIAYNSPMSHSRHPSSANVTKDLEVDERSLFKKVSSVPVFQPSVPRLLLTSPPQDGRMGTVPHRRTNQNLLASHSACSATVSRFQATPATPDLSFGHSSGWKSPIFKPPSSFRHSSSMSSLICPPPS
ncbi:putative E3 SUMO-protein ligase RNF212 [Sphaeramia orbicularis]|uniref:putative E3 SUMO-protein ligase RNF212 n=1 Tax=Sphaeramia orbicularis TaxID=375764 RepID=UPI00117C1B96|nr:probable E3 SUMO-protein ligase RNF212 [Sphaeramia orbicularis]